MVRRQNVAGDENFAAGVLPKSIHDTRRPRRRDTQPVEISFEEMVAASIPFGILRKRAAKRRTPSQGVSGWQVSVTACSGWEDIP